MFSNDYHLDNKDFLAGFIVGFVLVFPAFFYTGDVDLLAAFYCFVVPLVGGVVAGILRGQYGKSSAKPLAIAKAVRAGSIGAIHGVVGCVIAIGFLAWLVGGT